MSVQLRRRDLVQVAYHWMNAAAIAALLITGLAIYFAWPGTDFYFTGHLWGAWIFVVALIAHVWYDTITLKNFGRMWVTRRELSEGLSRLTRFRSRSSVEESPKHGHYKLEQIAFHWILVAVVSVVAITGFILWKPARIFLAPFWMPFGWDAVFVARVLHQLFTFILIAMIIAHIYFAVLVPKNWPYLRSIFTGRVLLSWYASHHRISPRLQSYLKPSDASEQSAISTGAIEGRKG